MYLMKHLGIRISLLTAVTLGVIAVSQAVAGSVAGPVGNAFSEPRRVTELNSDRGEWFPSISADGLAIVFSSNRVDENGQGGWDLYIATRETTDQPFANVQNLGPEINSPGNNYQAALSADRLELYFNDGPEAPRRDGLGTPDIWVATRANTDEPFGNVTLVPNINTEADENAPRPSADGLSLVFSSDRPGGSGGDDLWITRRADRNAPYETPQLIEDMFPGSQVNSSFEEWAPTLSADGLALLFSESLDPPYRQGGYGEGDIWVATRADPNAPFGAPVQVGFPLNTVDIDTGPSILGKWLDVGSTIYFISDRTGTAGVSDIWETTWSAAPLPSLELNTGEECLTAPASVSADAAATTTAEGTSIVSLVWDFGDGTVVEGSMDAPVREHTYTSGGLYQVTLTATNDLGESRTAGPRAVCVQCPLGDPGPWNVSQLGEPRFPGTAAVDSDADGNPELRICAGGSPPLGNADNHLMIHQVVRGDAQLRAKIVEISGNRPRRGVGLSFRADSTNDALSVDLTFRPEDARVRLKYRSATGENFRTAHFMEVVPVWLRLDRIADSYVAYTSEDGTTWTDFAAISPRIVSLPAEVSAGAIAFGGEPLSSEITNFVPLQARLSNVTITEQPAFRRGDTNDDAAVDIGDAVYLLNMLFSRGRKMVCRVAGNVNGDADVDLADAGFLLNFLFLGGPTPPAPFPGCGQREQNEATISCDRATNGCASGTNSGGDS